MSVSGSTGSRWQMAGAVVKSHVVKPADVALAPVTLHLFCLHMQHRVWGSFLARFLYSLGKKHRAKHCFLRSFTDVMRGKTSESSLRSSSVSRLPNRSHVIFSSVEYESTFSEYEDLHHKYLAKIFYKMYLFYLSAHEFLFPVCVFPLSAFFALQINTLGS